MPAATSCSCRSKTSSYLTRYGSARPEPRSTGSAAPAGSERKARMKKRMRDMAEGLIKIAAARALQ